MNYSLLFNFSSNDLDQIYASGQYVTLVKGIESSSQETPVVWTAFRPMMNNQVTWGTDFQAYASTYTQIMNGAMVSPSSQASVGFGQCIPYTGNGFGTPESGVASSTSMEVFYQASGQQITAGLSQAATVNGMRFSPTPLCALSLMAQMATTLTPLDSVSIYLGSYSMSGMVVTHLPSNAYTVSFNGATSCTVRYSSASGMFYS